jgi:hypothetical protein
LGCLISILGLLTPRVTIVLIWLFSDMLERAYQTTLWPVLGFLFMPYTTLAYMAAILFGGSVSGIWLGLVVVAVLADLGFFSHGAHTHYRRRPARRAD